MNDRYIRLLFAVGAPYMLAIAAVGTTVVAHLSGLRDGFHFAKLVLVGFGLLAATSGVIGGMVVPRQRSVSRFRTSAAAGAVAVVTYVVFWAAAVFALTRGVNIS